jgi:hypothetical protein
LVAAQRHVSFLLQSFEPLRLRIIGFGTIIIPCKKVRGGAMIEDFGFPRIKSNRCSVIRDGVGIVLDGEIR